MPDTQPILTLKDTSSNDAYLFKLAKGKLEFENLQLQLEPARAGFNAQTVVALIGEGQCGFKNCLVTLKPRPGGKSVPLSLVTLWAMEDAKMMMGEGKAAPPTVNVENCFVRGEGDLLNARGSRPVAVSVLNSLVHLKGSLYHQQQGAAKEVVDEPAIAFKLAKSVFLTADPLWLIQSGKSAQRHQHPIHVDRAESCLFARLDDQPLVGLDLPEVTEKNLPNLFKWDGEKNVFVNFDTASLVAQWPTEDVVRGFRLDQEDWKMFDPTAKFQARGFNRAAAKAFWQADPEELRRSLAEFDAYFDELILPKQQKQE